MRFVFSFPPRRSARQAQSVVLLMIVFGGAEACAVRRETVQPRPLGRDIPVYRAIRPAGRLPDSAFADPRDTLTLQRAVGLALQHSPDLAAFAWETRAREARALQAGRLPNPNVSFLAEDYGAHARTGAAAVPAGILRQTTLQLSQLVELGGKRTGRQRLATRELELAEWDFEAARINVLTNVTRAFVDLLEAQALVALTTQTEQLVAQVEQSVGARVVAGVASPIEETRAQVSRAQARVERRRAERALASSRTRLAGFWGRTSATFPAVTGQLDTIADVPALATLRVRLQQNPELARWGAEITLRRNTVSLEQARRIPDLSVLGGYRRFPDSGSAAYLFGVSLPLPLFDQNSGAVNEARSRLSKGYEERRAVEARVATALADAYRALASAHDDAVELRQTVLPGSRQAFEAVTEGYRLGRFSFLDVLDAQRTMIAASTRYLGTLAEYHKAVADVERLIGAPLIDNR